MLLFLTSSREKELRQIVLQLQGRHFRVKTGNHLSGYRVVIEWLSSGD